METQISPCVGALESHVVVNNDLRQPETTFRQICIPWARGRWVVSPRPNPPFRVNDRAIIRRQLGLGCFAHKRLSLSGFEQTIRRLSSARFLLRQNFSDSPPQPRDPAQSNAVLAIIGAQPDSLV